MCLSIAVNDPSCVLAKGTHDGYEFNVTHNNFGFRCGYVRIPSGHPWHGKNYDELWPDVHGGLTFSEADTPCDEPGPDTSWWLGFDCAHMPDAPDPTLPSAVQYQSRRGVVRTTDYVTHECHRLVEQAVKAQHEK